MVGDSTTQPRSPNPLQAHTALDGPDESLARLARSGSMPAFEELVRRFETRVYRFTLQLCGNAEDAAEITQDTFVKAYQCIAAFDPRLPFAPWLYTIARRKAIDRLRSAARRGAALPAEPALIENQDPAASLAAREQGTAIWEIARQSVSPLQFQALWLRYAEDMTLASTARVLRRPETYIKVLLFRARRILERKLRASTVSRGQPQAIARLGLRSGSLQQPHS